MITFHCACGRRNSAEDEAFGSHLECPACHADIIIGPDSGATSLVKSCQSCRASFGQIEKVIATGKKVICWNCYKGGDRNVAELARQASATPYESVPAKTNGDCHNCGGSPNGDSYRCGDFIVCQTCLDLLWEQTRVLTVMYRSGRHAVAKSKKPEESSALAVPQSKSSQGRKKTGGGWRDQGVKISIEMTKLPSGRLDKEAVARYQLDDSVLPYDPTISFDLVKALEIARKRQVRLRLHYRKDYSDGKPVQGYVCKSHPALSYTPNCKGEIGNEDSGFLGEECLNKVECADSNQGGILWEQSAEEAAATAQEISQHDKELEGRMKSDKRDEIVMVLVITAICLVIGVAVVWGMFDFSHWLASWRSK